MRNRFLKSLWKIRLQPILLLLRKPNQLKTMNLLKTLLLLEAIRVTLVNSEFVIYFSFQMLKAHCTVFDIIFS